MPRPGGMATSRVVGRTARLALHGAIAAAIALPLRAFTITLTPAAPATVFLQVGVGTYTGTYCGTNCNESQPVSPHGTPGTNTTINTASVTVPAASVGNGTAQAMTTNSTQSESFFDGFAFCNTPAQLYIGGFYRTTNSGNGAISVTATVPAALTNAAGAQLPFSQISWTSSGNADTGAEPFPAGKFVAGGVQTVGTIAQNQWAESCWTFSYVNSIVPQAGTYTGQVLFTASAP
jgi:hypothetical protein